MSGDLDLSAIAGLSQSEAELRLRQEGPNELPTSQKRGLLTIALEVVREPMFILLVACGGVYLSLGREHMTDALMLLGFVFIVMGITVVQERRTERALDALKDLSSPRAHVIRDGVNRRVAGREVVRGDMIVLAEGDRVPADAVLVQALNMSADESLLTGESVPVRKQAAVDEPAKMAPPGGDDLPFVFSGSLVSGGRGVAEVLGTGARTELGKIGRALQQVEAQPTLLQRETGRLVRTMATVGLSLCAVAVVVYALMHGGTRGAWEQGLLVGLTMAMATLPEEFPVVLTIFLALGAWRISHSRVLTRRMPVVETLGATTVLCVDKTGTLTQNQMTVQRLEVADGRFDATSSGEALPERFHRLLEFAILASQRDPFDPMEKALTRLGERHLVATEHLHASWTLVRQYPLSRELLAISHVWQSPDRSDYVLAAKGAPEAIADLCHLPEAELEALSRTTAAMSQDGLRVLGVARGRTKRKDLPEGQHEFSFDFIGLVGLADPVRANVPLAVRECRDAGIRVVMITGDYPGTARAIAGRAGLDPDGKVVTGPELEGMTDAQLAECIDRVSVFARAVPDHKLRIVQALQARGEVVAMTGDGVNDAPALKAAHIGIAMGARGTDVAREAASLVLLDDDFSSIVQAVKLGRRIFSNIKKAVSYILAIHVPIAGLSLLPVFLTDWPTILLPIHVVFLELIIDPACSIIFEAEAADPDTMTRPPRSPKEHLFSPRLVALALLQGVNVLAILVGMLLLVQRTGHSEGSVRAVVFATMVISNIALILTNRSWRRSIFTMLFAPNRAVWWVGLSATALLFVVLGTAPLRGVFHFDPVHGADLVVGLGAGAVSIAWFEIVKMIWRLRSKDAKP